MQELKKHYESARWLLFFVSLSTFLQLIFHFLGARLPHLISFSAPSKIFLLSLSLAKADESSLFLAFGIFTSLLLALLFALLRRSVNRAFGSLFLLIFLYALDLIPLTIGAATDFRFTFALELLVHLLVLFSLIQSYRAFRSLKKEDVDRMLNTMFFSLLEEESPALGPLEKEGATILLEWLSEDGLFSVILAEKEEELFFAVNGEVYEQVKTGPLPFIVRIGGMVRGRRFLIIHERSKEGSLFSLLVDGATVKEFGIPK